MSVEIQTVLNGLNDDGISPESRTEDPALPEVGEVAAGEWIFETSVDDVSVGRPDYATEFPLDSDGPLVREWWAEIEEIITASVHGPIGRRGGDAASVFAPGAPCA